MPLLVTQVWTKQPTDHMWLGKPLYRKNYSGFDAIIGQSFPTLADLAWEVRQRLEWDKEAICLYSLEGCYYSTTISPDGTSSGAQVYREDS